MALKKVSHSHISAETPEALFRDIKNKQSKGLISHQADILRKYCQPETLNLPDVALQLPTGSGKTVVGLLIAEWRRCHFNEKVVYLCPTVQLVNQVVEQSLTICGIKANAFTGKQAHYSPNIKAEYTNAETIAVTTYSGFFNTNTFFNNADVIILDDAHSAENYIAKYWSLSIERNNTKHSTLFKALVSSMRGIVLDAHYSRLMSDSPDLGDIQWVEKIPTPFLYERLEEITTILDTHINDIEDLQYSWSVLKDHLFSCHIYSSYNSILIRPVLPPTRTHQPFSTEGVSWLYQLTRLNLEENQENQADKLRLTSVIEALESQLSLYGNFNDKKFEAEVKAILENLQRVKDTQEDSKAFENGHERLGRLLGYEARNSNGDADPDPWWIASDDFCIVFEDHSPNNQGNSLGANKVRQAASHPNWIKQNIPSLRKESEIIPVVITPCTSITSGASPHTQDVCYWNQQKFQAWAEKAITVVRELKRSFPGEANLEWRETGMKAYQDSGLDPASLAKNLRDHKLANLPISG